MRVIGFDLPGDLQARFSSFVQTRDAYGFLRAEALLEPEREDEEIVIFDLATVPLRWLEENARRRKACLLRSRSDVEAFCFAQQKVRPVPFGLNDLVLVCRSIPVSVNERAAIRAVNSAFYSEPGAVLAEDGDLQRWFAKPSRAFSADDLIATGFQILRYRSRREPCLYAGLTAGDFVFEGDLSVVPTAIVVDRPADAEAVAPLAAFDDVFVFLDGAESVLELIGDLRNGTGRAPLVADQAGFMLDDDFGTLVRLRLA